MFKLRNPQATPPRGFKWIDPITGYVVTARNHANWISQASDHRVANGLGIPNAAEMEDQLCRNYDDRVRSQACIEYDENGVVTRRGPGSILKEILHGFGIQACWGCLDLAAKMDAWGPDGCEENMTYIVEAMQQNAEHRKWTRFVPFKEIGSTALVKLAIAKARLIT